MDTNTVKIMANSKSRRRWAIDLRDMSATFHNARRCSRKQLDPRGECGDTIEEKLTFLAAKGWSGFKAVRWS